jgi:adenosine deaminase
MPQRSKESRVELHTHLGATVSPAILWSIAHRQGIKLPTKNYWDFENMITMTEVDRNKNLDEMDHNFFHWTELIQSSPEAVQESVLTTIGGGYRKCNLILQELRFNPMKRNRGGERDLDHIIMAALWGMEQATLEYPQVKAGIILMMDRTLKFKENEIILKKALKYQSKGIIGIDLAGPQRKTFSMKKHAPLFLAAKRKGLGITLHTGEEGSIDELRNVVNKIKPHRIGHGVMCVKDKKIMTAIRKNNITLELCPTSNVKNSVFKNLSELKKAYQIIAENKIKFTINTDGPEMYRTNLYKEQNLLLTNHIFSNKQITQARRWAWQASFIK